MEDVASTLEHCEIKDFELKHIRKESALFVVLTFLISWVAWGTLILLNIPAKGTAASTILYMVGGFGPTIIALLLPLLAKKGMKSAYFKRYFNFHLSAKWFLIPAIPAILIAFLTYGYVCVFKPEVVQNMTIQPLYMVVPFFISMIIGGGLEELGWRGILVHNARSSQIVLASLLIGAIWAAWHIPLFFIQGVSQYQSDFIPFFLSVIGYSFILTGLQRKTGSTIPCIIFHALYNAFAALGFHSNKTSVAESIVTLGVGACFFLLMNRKYKK